MRVLLLALSVVACAQAASALAQDVSVSAIRQPVSGCALTGSESVSIRIFNYGSTLPAGSSFNASYTINAGAPVIEPITLGANLLSNSSLDYTFTTQADLSTPGAYTFDAAVSLVGDVNASNNTLTGQVVTNDAPSAGGIATGPSDATLDGLVTLTAQTGSIAEWQQSDDGGFRWRRLANTTNTQPFAQLRENTAFRALVRSGSCPPALSTAAIVFSSDPIFYSGFEP